jgi:hypothetical protein
VRHIEGKTIRRMLSEAGYSPVSAQTTRGEGFVPTDVLLAFTRRRREKNREAADLQAILLLIPMVACLYSILLSVESLAFESAMVTLGLE